MRKPSVNTNPVANKYTGPHERIIEVSSAYGGCLIGLRLMQDGRLLVDVYREDPTVNVLHGQGACASVRSQGLSVEEVKRG